MSPVIRAADVRHTAGTGTSLAALATPSLGAEEHLVCRVRLEPDRSGGAHSHDREEVFVALAGSATARVGDERFDVREGDVVIAPAGALHAFATGEEAFECFCVMPRGIRTFDEDGVERPPLDALA